MIMFSLALTIFGASKNVSAQAQGHVTQYLYKGYKVTYTINSEWEDCYIASLTIESTGEYAIDNYALSFFMNDMIEEIWGADIYSYEGGIYTVNSEGYEQSIPFGKRKTISFRAKKKDVSASIPENFKIISSYTLLDKVAYKLEIDSENDYQTKITIRNISDDTIMGWNIKFNTSMKKITSDIGEIKKQYDYYTFVHNQDIVIKPNQVFSFHVYGDKIDEKIRLSNFSIYSSRIIDVKKYANILFTSKVDSDATAKFMPKDKNHVEVKEGEYVTIDIKTDLEKCLSEKAEYSGVASFLHNNTIIHVHIKGELYILNEGVFGYLYGEYDGSSLAVTINDAFVNTEPYVMISFGELESGQDYYKVYGKRMKENDIMSDLITENNEVENSSEKIVSMEESEDFAKGEVAIKKKVKNNKDYETLARTVQYSVYSYGGKHYYLGAISLYCPKKTHGNELYAARAKINTHEGNAQYYFRKAIKMPGAITYFHHDADLNIYTGSKRVDFIKASPNTTSWFTPSLSISIPFGNFLSLSIANVTVPAGIKQKFSKIKGFTYDNKSQWNFNSQYSADIANNNALTTKKGYAGYVQFVYSSKKTGNYHIYTKGTIHYKMKTRLSIYQYNSAFNVSVSTNCEVANS